MSPNFQTALRPSFRLLCRHFCGLSAPLKNLYCPACKSGALQIREDVFCCMTCPNRHEIDYFKLLGLPRVYNLNLQDAEERFRTLQKSAHPDKIDEIDAKNLPEGFSSLLNKAIKVLKSPTERAMHLLYLIDGCSLSESELTNDPGLLMEMMEANEAIDDCGRNKSCLEIEAELNQQRLDACDSELRNLFADRKFPAARKVCEKMHYLERIKDTLIRKLNSVQ